MTVTYTGEVATCRGFGTFLRLLSRWHGSIYKLVWLDLILFLSSYYFLNILYRFILTDQQKLVFESVVFYCSHHGNVIPLSFVLGFYVTVVMNRWWGQYTSIPWPDPIAVDVSSHIHGQDERGRVIRRTIMRYVCVCLTIVLTNISPRVKKRFPTINNLVEAGLLLDNERDIMENLNKKFPKHSKHWMPIVWAASIVTRARKEGRIRDDFAVKTIIDELNKFRGNCGLLISYDNISVPLVYTQVVTLAVYSYFITSAMGSQWTANKVSDENSRMANIDIYFPIFSTLEFFFYMGWLKVAESLINPFGEDDDDFEVNWIIDRNLQVSYMIVDEMHHEHPELVKDQYWDEVFPAELPYTVASEGLREEHPQPSTAKIEVPPTLRNMVISTPSAIKIDEMVNGDQTVSYKFPPSERLYPDDASSGIHFFASRGGSKKYQQRPTSMGSTVSVQSAVQPSLSRVNSVTSVLKRLFSRDDANRQVPGTPVNNVNTTDGPINNTNKFQISSSNASLAGKFVGGGSMKLANDVIEELDEQNTITSMALKEKDIRPTAASLFAQGPPTPSAPVNVPKRNSGNPSTLSSSAPVRWSSASCGQYSADDGSLQNASTGRQRFDSDVGPQLSAAASVNLDKDCYLGGSDDLIDQDDDEFDALRAAREKQRKEKFLQRLMARSISTQQAFVVGDCMIDNEMLLRDLTLESDIKTAELKSKSTEKLDKISKESNEDNNDT